MILTCPACQTRYQADAAKFPPQGRSVRCAKCGEVWHQAAPEPEPGAEAFVAQPAPASSSPPPPPPSYPAAEPPPPQVYVQPPIRDVEPQPDMEETQPEESIAPPPSEWPRRIALGAGWVALAVVVIVIGIAATAYRQQIVQVWPQSASLYSRLGMKVRTAGLDIHNIKYTEGQQDGQIVLTVTGALTNVSSREQPVPQIRVGLVDNDQRELYHWTFAPDVMTLRPGQSHNFVTRLSSPPDRARYVNVRFAKAGE